MVVERGVARNPSPGPMTTKLRAKIGAAGLPRLVYVAYTKYVFIK